MEQPSGDKSQSVRPEREVRESGRSIQASTVNSGTSHPSSNPATDSPSHSTPTQPHLDGYEIIDTLGRGGMGVVYKARDVRLKRMVALKMILAAEHADKGLLQRFHAEAETVARLQHSNIVQIYDVGEQSGHPYLSLEFVDGPDLAKFIKGEPQPPQVAAELLEAMARAMDYAHQQGVVHRDLKPANVLLATSTDSSSLPGASSHPNRNDDATTDVGQKKGTDPQIAGDEETIVYDRNAASDSKPDSSFSRSRKSTTTGALDSGRHGTSTGLTPKITDFGLAKQLDTDAELTSTGQILGTASYMAPEQAEGRVRDVGPAADVYSLGAILYVLLTGRPPFQGTTALETVRMVSEAEPVPPTQLQHGLSIDLETICLKCLQKDRQRRYATAGELADELRRFLDDKPILARPVGRAEKLRRWCRRNPIVASLSAACVTLFLVGFVLVAWKWTEAASANSSLTTTNAQLTTTNKDLKQARGEIANKLKEVEAQKKLVQDERDEVGRQKAEADKQKGIAQDERDAATKERDAAKKARDTAEWRLYLNHIETANLLWEFKDVPGALSRLSGAPENHQGWEYRYLQKSFANNRIHQTLGEHPAVWRIVLSPDGTHMASGSRYAIRIWDLKTNRLVQEIKRGAFNITFSPDGSRLITSNSSDEYVRLWDARIGIALASYKHSGGRHYPPIVAFSENGEHIVAAHHAGSVLVWSIETGNEVSRFRTDRLKYVDPTKRPVISPTGDKVIRDETGIQVWDVKTGTLLHKTDGEKSYRVLGYTPNGKQLVAIDREYNSIPNPELTFWDSTTLERKTAIPLSGHPKNVSPDGTRIVCARDGMLTVLDAKTGISDARLNWRPHAAPVSDARFSAEGNHIFTCGGSTIKKWDIRPHETVKSLDAYIDRLAINPNGRQLLALTRRPEIEVWDAVTGKRTGTMPGKRFVSFSHDGRFVVTGDPEKYSNDAKILYANSGKERMTLTKGGSCAVFSKDDSLIATSSWDLRAKLGGVTLWDVETGKKVATLAQSKSGVTAIAFCPHGRQLAVGRKDGSLALWEIESRKKNWSVDTGSEGYDIEFSPDGSSIVTGGRVVIGPGDQSAIRTVKVWDSRTGTRLMVLEGHVGAMTSGTNVAFSPDGTRIVSGGADSTLKLWNARTGEETLTIKAHESSIHDLLFSPDGNRIISCSRDNSIKIWDAQTSQSHFNAAKVAEQREDWYAAAFHLGWLLIEHPNSVSFKKRHAAAEETLRERGLPVPPLPANQAGTGAKTNSSTGDVELRPPAKMPTTSQTSVQDRKAP